MGIERAIFRRLHSNEAEGNLSRAKMSRRAIVLVAVIALEMLVIVVGFLVLEAMGEPMVVGEGDNVRLSRGEYFLT